MKRGRLSLRPWDTNPPMTDRRPVTAPTRLLGCLTLLSAAIMLVAVIMLGLESFAPVTCELRKPGDSCPPGQVLMWFWGEHWLCVYPWRWQVDMHRCFYGELQRRPQPGGFRSVHLMQANLRLGE
jgi:hypothetical protein